MAVEEETIMNIKLFCNAGLSTSILVKNIAKEAQAQNQDVQVAAYPIDELARQAKDADVVLLGPQVAYRLQDAQKICAEANVPVSVIDMAVYGMCDGKKALDIAMKLKK
jgi:PTS system cellobiose-specific IIB component